LKRASFNLFADELRKQGISEKRIRIVLENMIKNGFAEGNDRIGYILTEKGVIEAEKIIYGRLGVV
jgi:repressor of nif and glnA expression